MKQFEQRDVEREPVPDALRLLAPLHPRWVLLRRLRPGRSDLRGADPGRDRTRPRGVRSFGSIGRRDLQWLPSAHRARALARSAGRCPRSSRGRADDERLGTLRVPPHLGGMAGGGVRSADRVPEGIAVPLSLRPRGGEAHPRRAPGKRLSELTKSGQVLFRWTTPDRSPVRYPWNPNGSEGDVAGLTNPEGNVFGLMPHPERAFDRSQAPDWTRSSSSSGPGDGYRFLDAVVSEAVRLG